VREIRRAYGEVTVKTRLHQAHFRKDVLGVYRGRCCVCELQARPLLQGAHIVPDSDVVGVPSVQNGLSLCALHHAAYDRDILRIDPECRIKVEHSWIKFSDRFAQVSLSEFDGKPIQLPKHAEHRPDRVFLEARFNR
jgi:putative restriction endonuclease